jgi:hypothetical protein
MRTSRFQSFTPPLRTTGLRRLKTAFSPSSTTSSNYSYTLSGSSTASAQMAGIFSSSSSTTSTTSPLSGSLDSSDLLPPHSPTTSSCCSSHGSEKSGPITVVHDLPGNFMPMTARSRFRMFLLRRRKQSMVDLRLEEERRNYSAGLRLFEPRPTDTVVMGGIFEVLEGGI